MKSDVVWERERHGGGEGRSEEGEKEEKRGKE